jgi:hypothetical protein
MIYSFRGLFMFDIGTRSTETDNMFFLLWSYSKLFVFKYLKITFVCFKKGGNALLPVHIIHVKQCRGFWYRKRNTGNSAKPLWLSKRWELAALLRASHGHGDDGAKQWWHYREVTICYQVSALSWWGNIPTTYPGGWRRYWNIIWSWS